MIGVKVSVTITHVRFGDETKIHAGIVRYRWKNDGDGSVGDSPRAAMVDWIETKGGEAFVGFGSNRVKVYVVDAAPKYLRTASDGKWSNNLLSLPEF